ncbi:Pilin (type 1 fimbria component protein) [Paraburkholderia fungorum]|uniref:Pilin (Type 1 fimbria component protein) n=1 Tax=Paraburkholderia fungorum TaxID=134537 RepID=A0A1H1IZV5_9BURK|nr:fimbrial protein [Paraburkholderia fungorum]SDR43203.1 Pilin (type 1 fimbria component protein) [Paraburkholderia fungorum]
MFRFLKIKVLMRLALLLVCVSPFASVWATCKASNVTANFPPIASMQRDAPNGTVLATAQTTMTITCDSTGSGSGDGSWLVGLSAANGDFGAASVANTRLTNYSGVGLQWVNLNSNTGTNSSVSSGQLNISSWQRGIKFEGTTTLTDTWTLVKADNIASGTLALPALSYTYKTSTTMKEMGALATINFSSLGVVAQSCSLNTPTVNVPMGDYSKSAFRGIGSTTKSVPVKIGLSCSNGARINVQLTVTADASQPGTIKLTPGAGAASGVGIQMLDAWNNPLPLNTNFVAGTATAEGVYNVDWSAQYIQTASQISAGAANATAVFTLTYQ